MWVHNFHFGTITVGTRKMWLFATASMIWNENASVLGNMYNYRA